MLLIPDGGADGEQLRQRLVAQSLARLRQRAAGDVGIDFVRQDKSQMGDNIGDRLMAIKRQRNHQPDHMLGRQLAPPNARFARAR
jgi:hypothetical protein